MVIGILTVCALDAYTHMEPISTYSHATSYFALDFKIKPELLLEPSSVSTPIGDSFITSHVYRSCVVVIQDRETR